jgi:hypothetical protein
MRKIILLTLCTLIINLSFAKKVKFSVDMRYQIVSLLGVHVMGDFQSEAGFPGDWESGTTEMLNEVGTSIYSVVVDIPTDTKYEYRFVNGDQTYEAEFVPVASRVGYDFIDNRWVFVHNTAEDTLTLAPLLFGGNAPFGKKLLRVFVDLSKQTSPSTNGIYIAGNFQQWNTSADRLYNFVAKVYELIVYADSASTVQYKFYNGTDAEVVPPACASNGNRSIVLNSDSVLTTVCFASCSDCASTGINIMDKKNDINVYPNPVSEHMNIIFENNLVKDISIVNTQGQVMRSYWKYAEKELILNNISLDKGMYMIKVVDANGTNSIKFIVE